MTVQPVANVQGRKILWWKDTRLLVMVGLGILGTFLLKSDLGLRSRSVLLKRIGNWRKTLRTAKGALDQFMRKGRGVYRESIQALGRSASRSHRSDVTEMINALIRQRVSQLQNFAD